MVIKCCTLRLALMLTCATCSNSSGLPFTLLCISLISCWYSFLRWTSCFLQRTQSYGSSYSIQQLMLQSCCCQPTWILWVWCAASVREPGGGRWPGHVSTPPSAASSPSASAFPSTAPPPPQPSSSAPAPFYSGRQSGHRCREVWMGWGLQESGGRKLRMGATIS